MNRMKIGLSLVIGICTSVMVVVMPTSPVLAAETIELDPEEGEIGDEVEISGDDFDKSNIGSENYVYVRVYFAADEADRGDEIDDEVDAYRRVVSSVLVDTVGDFDRSFNVPSELTSGSDDESVTTGTYYVYVTYSGDDEIIAVAEFQIIGGEIEIYPDEGFVGTEVTINGTGFIDDVDRPARGVGHCLGDGSNNSIGPTARPVHNHGRDRASGPGGRLGCPRQNNDRGHHCRTCCPHRREKFSAVHL